MLVLLLLSSGGAVARAAPNTAAAVGAALKKFQDGTTAFEAGRYFDALRAFRESMELEGSPNTRFKIAKCYAALGKTASAYVNYRRTVQEAQDRINATGELRFAPTRDAAQQEAAELEPTVPKVQLKLRDDLPPGLSLTIDGSEIQQVVWRNPIEVDPGRHLLIASGPRIKRFELNFDIQPAELQQLEVPINVVPTAALMLGFRKKPSGLAVEIDARPLAPEQFDKPQYVDVGEHVITATAPGYQRFQLRRSFVENETAVVQVQLRMTGASPKWAFFAAGGAAVAALAVGIGFGVKANAAADEQLMLQPRLRDPLVQEGVKTDATIANVFFAVGGVFSITAGVLAFTTQWHRDGGESKPASTKVAGGFGALPLTGGEPAFSH